MGDYCIWEITLHKKDIGKYAEISGYCNDYSEIKAEACFDEIKNETQNSITGIRYDEGYDDLPKDLKKLAEAGLSFIGWYSQTDYFDSMSLVAHNSKYTELHVTGNKKHLLIPISEDGVSQSDLERAREYFETKKVLEELFK